MYNNFDELIQGIHDGFFEENEEIFKEPKLIIDAQKRTLTPENDFNLQVGVTNDYNTNIVSFKCDKILEHHSLVECNNKIIKWHNTSSNVMGSDVLQVIENEPDSDQFTLSWLVPPEATTKAGTLKIAICFCDVENDTIAYKWNSLVYSGLQVGQGMDNISVIGIPLSEVIDVNVYNRTITLPADYNTTIGIQGAYGTATLIFRINRFFNDWDFTEGDTEIQILYTIGTEQRKATPSGGRIIESLSGNIKEDWLEFYWEVPTEIFNQSGNFSIAIGFVSYEKGKIWRSKELTTLNIESSIFGDEAQIPEGSNEGWLFISQEELTKLLTEEYMDDIEYISFYITNTKYEAIQGMTWEEWCQSMYNTSGYKCLYEGQVAIGERYKSYVANSSGILVNKKDLIIANHHYIHEGG